MSKKSDAILGATRRSVKRNRAKVGAGRGIWRSEPREPESQDEKLNVSVLAAGVLFGEGAQEWEAEPFSLQRFDGKQEPREE